VASRAITNNQQSAWSSDGNVTLNGTANLAPNQTAASGASVMTRDLGDARYKQALLDEFGFNTSNEESFNLNQGTASFGGGGVQYIRGVARPFINNGASTGAFAYVERGEFMANGGSGLNSDTRYPFVFRLIGQIGSHFAIANSGVHYGLMNYATGLLTNRGWQVSILTNGNLLAGVHNGTALTSATNTTLTLDAARRFVLVAHWSGGSYGSVLNVYGREAAATAQMPPTNSFWLSVTNAPGANTWSANVLRIYTCGVSSNTSGSQVNLYITKASLTE
jgi:hypothetical protein